VRWIVLFGATLDGQFNLLAHVNQTEKRAIQTLAVLDPLLNSTSGLSVSNTVLLYKQLIRLTTHCACPIWRSAACSQVQKLQVLQPKCLCIATDAACYVGNRQIQEDLGIPSFADRIRALTDSLDPKSADAGNPLVLQLARHCADRGELTCSRPAEAVPKRRPIRHNV
jgi:hypothetical protein